jgi:hypothetical protein
MSTIPTDEKMPGGMAGITTAPTFEAVDALKAVKAGHADDVDIAAQILANNIDIPGTDSWTVAEDKRLIRKVDWRLIPIVSLCLVVVYFPDLTFRAALCLCHSVWT